MIIFSTPWTAADNIKKDNIFNYNYLGNYSLVGYRRIFVYIFCLFEILQRMYGSLTCHPAISQFLMADISFSIAWKELKIAQIAQANVLFQLLNLVGINSHGFYEIKLICQW